MVAPPALDSATSLLKTALAYALEQGYRVFPLHSIRKGKCTCIPKSGETCEHPGKHPRTKNGVYDATRNEATIRQWWKQWPDANIGFAMGEGRYVVDEDTYKGANHADLGELPETLTVRTGGGGYQYYFSIPQEMALPNTVGTLGKWIDTKGAGGYVVAPGSRHLSGNTYEWLNDAPLAPLPAHLVERLEKKPKAAPLPPAERSPRLSTIGDTPYGLAALDDECRTLSSTPEGQRNDQLNRSAYLMGNLVAGDELTESTAEQSLRAAALRCGLGEREIEKTLQSGLNDGMLNPRKAPPREKESPPASVVESAQEVQPATLEEALALIAELEQKNADLEQKNQLQAEVIAGTHAHIFSKWEKEATRVVDVAALLIAYERVERKLQRSLFDTFPMVMSSGNNAKGERYAGLAERLNLSREKVGEAFQAVEATGQMRRCERYDEMERKSHYDYRIDRSFISNEHPVTDKKVYTVRAPQEAKKPIEKTVDVVHTCLECGSPNLDITCRDNGHLTQLGEVAQKETQEVEVMSEIPTLLASHLGSVENSDMTPESEVDQPPEPQSNKEQLSLEAEGYWKDTDELDPGWPPSMRMKKRVYVPPALWAAVMP